jgi:AAA+ superfamily predicted ATPase
MSALKNQINEAKMNCNTATTKMEKILQTDLIRDKLPMIFDENAIRSLVAFSRNCKEITKVIGKIEKLSKLDKFKISKTMFSELLGVPTKELGVDLIDDFEMTSVMYWQYKAVQENKATHLRKNVEVLSDRDIVETYYAYKIHEGEREIKLTENLTLFNIDDVKFIMGIKPPRTHHESSKTWVIHRSSQSQEVYKIINMMKLKYNLCRSRVINVSSHKIEFIQFRPKFTLNDVVLPKNILRECEFVNKMFEEYTLYEQASIPFKRNILFLGDPGIGKTTAVNALIQSALNAGGSAVCITDSYNIDEAYHIAESTRPSIVIIEDFDLMAGSRSNYYGHNNITSEILNILDGTKNHEGVITIATSNINKEELDTAAIRTGRMDRIYRFSYPDNKMKAELLENHMLYYKLSADNMNIIRRNVSHWLNTHKISGAIINGLVLSLKQSTVMNEVLTDEEIKWTMNGLEVEKDEKINIL